jgi:hypothetical protein
MEVHMILATSNISPFNNNNQCTGKVEDENTNFFHATATSNHNRNTIMMLKDNNGQEKYSHEEKVVLIWEAFKDRLGTSEFSQMHYNLSELLCTVSDLEH